jgi:hypothetical protein
MQYPGVIIAAIPNGGRRNPREAAIMKSEGVRAGMPDLVIPCPTEDYYGLWIEMKTEKGKVSPSQKLVLDQLTNNCYRCEVCHSLDEFATVVNDYMRNGCGCKQKGKAKV